MAGQRLMSKQTSRWRWLPAVLVLGAAILVAQSQPQSQPQPPTASQPQAQPSAQQQALEALADKLIAAPDEEARNTLLSTNGDLLTVDLIHILHHRAGVLYDTRKDLSHALAADEIALTIAQRINDKTEIANSFRDVGVVLDAQEDHEAALDYLRRAIALSEEINDPGLAASYSQIGVTLRHMGSYQEAADYLNRAVKLREAQGDKPGLARASFNLGNVYQELGNQRLALQQYQRSMEISKELGIESGIAYNANGLGTVYEAQGDYDLALSYYQQSLKLKEKFANPAQIATTLMNIGQVYQDMGNVSLARENYEKALKLKEANGDQQGTALVLHNYGWMLREQGNFSQALEIYQESLKISESLGDKFLFSQTMIEMARIYCVQHDYARALELGQRASEIAREMGNTEVLSQALDVVGLALAGLGRAEEAHSTMLQAIAEVEELRGQVAGAEEESAGFLDKKIEPYQHMVRMLVSEDKSAEAFEFTERAKARVLLDVMRSGRVHVDKAMTAQENEQEHKLLSRLASLNVQLSAEKAKPTPNTTHIAQLNADLDQARLDYRDFQTSLYTAHPELQVARGDVKPVSLAQAAPLLPDAKTALLEFLVTADETYLFVLVKAADASTPQLTAYTLPIGEKELTTRVDRFRQQLATRDPEYGQPARALYRLLLRPAHAALAGKTMMVIVPDGPLWELPFQALQSSDGHHLLQEAAISYAPSLTVLLEMARRHRESRSDAPRLLALGNPAFKGQAATGTQISQLDPDPVSHAQENDAERSKSGDLPSAEREVAGLGRLYGSARSSVYIRAAADEKTFKEEAPKYDVLHLATHGVFDDRSPMYSHLVLSAGDDPGEDGLLEAWEVINLNLKADLVVLSACETARGKASSGEGLIGMSWAFFVAGAPSLVASQWKVDSASTTELMLHFHRGLHPTAGAQGHSLAKARALQQAELSVMKRPEYRHPYYWAGFVIVGDGL
ncbi:MAG TPA: CHAT domain-containing tetratricopeptide repeat protein [Terriglobales bacterium]|jgi:CHAT domain-containing protein/Tfp pilus assembly protein PilF|nr:CHAT domain-containing tetratricopeptide repeat protein [Terriglobales bacterium]